MAINISTNGDVAPDTALQAKREALYAHLRGLGRLLVAYSANGSGLPCLGGPPGTGRADAGRDGRFAVAGARADEGRFGLCLRAGFPVEVIHTEELDNADYRKNDAMRCFHCKDELFAVMERYAAAPSAGQNWQSVAYGVNLDDQGEWRPGQKAAAQHGVGRPCWRLG